jgi:peptide-methionine (S)-S-oxide reductase
MMRITTALLAVGALGALVSCSDRPTSAAPSPSPVPEVKTMNPPPPPTPPPAPGTLETATLGAGCFWCIEAVFESVDGVKSAVSGYSGGHVKNPTYEQVCEKTTGHAEVAQIVFDPAKISFERVLEIFWGTHDPTTPNRQGNDVGPQYRSAIFYHSEAQKASAERLKKALDAAGVFSAPIVTEITAFQEFWVAEEEHQDFYRRNPNQGYCRAIIRPKMEKFKKVFEKDLKK